MVGSVFWHEMMLAGRRFGLHAVRWTYGGWLVLQVLWFYIEFQAEQVARWQQTRLGAAGLPPASAPEAVGSRFAESFVHQQALLLLLLVPAMAAGAISDEKRNGTLQLLMLTEVESRHIVLGKLLARALQVLLVLAAGVPLFAILAGFGGVPPTTLLLVGASLLPPLVGLSSLALLASAWGRQTRDAMLATYVVVLAGALAVRLLGGPLRPLDPLHAVEPALGPAGAHDLPEALSRLAASAVLWGIIAAACLILTSATLRHAIVPELQEGRRGKVRWYAPDREPIDDDPVRWRERHVEGLAPNAFLRAIPQWLGILLVAGATTASCLLILAGSLIPGAAPSDLCRALLALDVRSVAAMMPDASTGFLVQGVAVMLLFSLAVGVRSSGAVTGERERRTWEALLLTPQSARQIIHGKLWGVMSASFAYLLAYAAPALSLSVLSGPLGLAFAAVWTAVTGLAMYFIGAVGMWCSVRAPNSWRSLLNTVLIGYLGGLAIYAVTSPGILILMGMLLLVLVFIDLAAGTAIAAVCIQNRDNLYQVFGVASALALAAIFMLMSRLLLRRAQLWVAERERPRHWHDELLFRRGPR